MASFKGSIQADMKAALRAGDKPRLGTIRMLLAAIQRREVDERIELDDNAVLQIIEKLVKQGAESVKQFAAGGRDDLVAKERAEIEILQAYLPEPLSEAELDTLIKAAIQSTAATSITPSPTAGSSTWIVSMPRRDRPATARSTAGATRARARGSGV